MIVKTVKSEKSNFSLTNLSKPYYNGSGIVVTNPELTFQTGGVVVVANHELVYGTGGVSEAAPIIYQCSACIAL